MRVQLFTGKGGVGKTTLAAAAATHLAAAGRKALVVSTDPTRSLADVLGVPVGHHPVEIDGLFAAQVDTRRLVDGSWAPLREHLAVLLAGAGVDELAAEELTVLPGVDELLALAEVHDLASGGPWEVVLVDCAPTAETLRLLALPEAVAGYLERLFPTHRRLVGGVLPGMGAVLDRWQHTADALSRLAERLDALRAMLTDPAVTGVRLVLTPERIVAAEARRTLTALALLGIQVDGLIVNRLVPAPDAGSHSAADGEAHGDAAAWLGARRAEQDAVLAQLREWQPALPVHTVPYLPTEPVGPTALAAIGELLPAGDCGPDQGPSTGGLLSVRRTAGSGRSLDSEFELHVKLPLGAGGAVELARVGDDLAITVDGRRRLVGLPAALRRCVAVDAAATQHAGGVTVRFRPDPQLWMR